MVHPENAALAVDVLEQQLRLPQDILRAKNGKAALTHPFLQRRTRLHHQRQQADVLRLHGAECLRRTDGVLPHQLPAPKS